MYNHKFQASSQQWDVEKSKECSNSILLSLPILW